MWWKRSKNKQEQDLTYGWTILGTKKALKYLTDTSSGNIYSNPTEYYWVLAEKRGKYQRLFRMSDWMVEEGTLALCKRCDADDETYFKIPPVNIMGVSSHLREYIYRMLCAVPDRVSYDSLSDRSCNETWFNGLNFESFIEEIKKFDHHPQFMHFTVNNIKRKKYTWNNELIYHSEDGPNHGVVERFLKFDTFISLYSIIDWTGINVLEIIDSPYPEFPVRNEPIPEPTQIEHRSGNSVRPHPIVYHSTPQEDNTPRCPTCRSTNIEKLGMVGKIVSVEALGLASNKIGKQFKCKNCGYMW